MPLLLGLLRSMDANRTMVFVNTKRCERLEPVLNARTASRRQACRATCRRRSASLARALPRRRARGADRDRRRGARPAHPGCQPRLQLRPAAGRRGLRAPHRPHRARSVPRATRSASPARSTPSPAGHRGLHRAVQDPVWMIPADRAWRWRWWRWRRRGGGGGRAIRRRWSAWWWPDGRRPGQVVDRSRCPCAAMRRAPRRSAHPVEAAPVKAAARDPRRRRPAAATGPDGQPRARRRRGGRGRQAAGGCRQRRRGHRHRRRTAVPASRDPPPHRSAVELLVACGTARRVRLAYCVDPATPARFAACSTAALSSTNSVRAGS
jgi:hypothetical protein